MIDPLAEEETPEQSAARQRAEAARAMLVEAVRQVATTPDGRLLLRLVLFGFADLIGPSGSEKREGARDVGRKLLDLVDDADLSLFPDLLVEQRAEEAARRAGS